MGFALPDEFEGEIAHFRVFFVLKDLKPIHNRPNRADDVVADSRTQQGRKVHGVKCENRHVHHPYEGRAAPWFSDKTISSSERPELKTHERH